MDDFERHVVDSLGRIETKLDSHTGTLDDHEGRIRKSEITLQRWTGMAKAITGVAATGSFIYEAMKGSWHKLFH